MIPRQLTEYITRMKKVFPILSITGPRQSGKTTLIKNIFPDKPYFNLENLDERAYVQADPRQFLLKECPHGAVIDEAQHVPELFSYLQGHVDQAGEMGEFILSGSQNFLLLEKITQSLAGRVCVIHLLPFAYQEIQHLKDFDIDTLVFQGMYPALYDRNISPKDWFRAYISTYIERDVRQIKQVADLSKFQTFLKLCAGRTGQLLNFSALGIETGVDQSTIKAWISVLEASFIAFRLPPYYKSNRRLIKMSKFYFYDTGLACYLLEINSPEDLRHHHLKGGLFENFIISEMIKTRWNKGEDHHLYFWRDHKGVEIDVMFEHSGQTVPVEIKAGMTVTPDYFKNLGYVKDVETMTKPYIIYAGEKGQDRTAVSILNWKDTHKIFHD